MSLQYQMNTEQLSEKLTKLNNSLDPKSVSAKSSSEVLLQLEVRRSILPLAPSLRQLQAPAPGCGRG